MIFVDTNIFVIDLRYKRDRHFKKNRSFLDLVAKSGHGVTSIYNLLEVCGILSFNLNEQQLLELFHYLPSRYSIDVLPSHDGDMLLPQVRTNGLLEMIARKASFGDATIAYFVKKNLPRDAVFVSWDATHFRNLLAIRVATPEEFQASQSPLLSPHP